MRVVHVTPCLDPCKGGTVTAAMALVQAQLAQHHEVTVVSTFGAGCRPDDAADQLRRHGADVRLIGPVYGPIAWHWQIGRALRHAIRGASIVHIHAVWEEIQHKAARVARRFGVPYVITPHGMLDPWSLRQRSLKKRLYLRLRLRRNLDGAAAIHCTTTTERDGVGALDLHPAATIVEPYSIDFSEFADLPAPGWLRAKFPAIGNRKILLFFSRLHYKKGLELLIPAFAQAKRDDAVLVLAGPVEPAYEQQIDDLILVHGMRDRVFKTGMLRGRDRVAALADADLFVLPSYQENFGIAVVESLAASTPVIISDQVQIHGCVTRGRVGAVVPTQIEPLRDAIVKWLDDDALRADAAARARPFVFEEYEARRSARRWSTHYARIVAAAARRTEAASAAPEPRIHSGGAGTPAGVAALTRHHAG